MIKHENEGKILTCAAKDCASTIRWGTRRWTNRWVSVWVERDGVGRSYDACSLACSDKIKEEKARTMNEPSES